MIFNTVASILAISFTLIVEASSHQYLRRVLQGNGTICVENADCDDGDPKTVDVCEQDYGCTNTCNDGNACTQDSIDEDGQCVFEWIDCDDGLQ